ncbi:uncharacterized protein LOC121986694 [Zingiber officinale]|uniref:uncharacterized protein LOC121986694 n=1 Tax=Zingiber officinale TaxID=94328 RepID=UPI001C4C62C9|nr:uncharacterized protein LOC121986694 [Zingiber officinale]
MFCQKIKFPVEISVEEVKGDQLTSYRCYIEMVKMEAHATRKAQRLEVNAILEEPPTLVYEEKEEVQVHPTRLETTTFIVTDLSVEKKVELVAYLRKNHDVFAWVTHELLVSKTDNKWRVCIHFHNLNKAFPKDYFLLPHIDQMVDFTSNCELIYILDQFNLFGSLLISLFSLRGCSNYASLTRFGGPEDPIPVWGSFFIFPLFSASTLDRRRTVSSIAPRRVRCFRFWGCPEIILIEDDDDDDGIEIYPSELRDQLFRSPLYSSHWESLIGGEDLELRLGIGAYGDLNSNRWDTKVENPNAQKSRKALSSQYPFGNEEVKLRCSICMDTMKEETSTTCGHIFCNSCITNAIHVQRKCPTCRLSLSMSNIHRIYLPGASS